MANLCRRGHLKRSSKHAVCTKCYAIDREKHHALAHALLAEAAARRRAAAEEQDRKKNGERHEPI